MPACSDDERTVHELYRGFDIELVESHDIEPPPKFIEAGVPVASESLFALTLS